MWLSDRKQKIAFTLKRISTVVVLAGLSKALMAPRPSSCTLALTHTCVLADLDQVLIHRHICVKQQCSEEVEPGSQRRSASALFCSLMKTSFHLCWTAEHWAGNCNGCF